MEELIGDITDEYDLPADPAPRHVDELDGLTTIEEFAELTGYVIPEGPYDTVAGFFMALLGALPKLGDTRRPSAWRRRTSTTPPRAASPSRSRSRRPPGRLVRAAPGADPRGGRGCLTTAPGLLTGPRVEPLLRAAVEHQGGQLLSWSLDHVDAAPEQSTTATYLAQVALAARRAHRTARGQRPHRASCCPRDARAEIFEDGHRRVAVWLYPNDPDLLGLPRAAFPDRMAETLNAGSVLARPVTAEQLSLSMIAYRPRRRAVVKVVVNDPHEVFYVKVLRERMFADVHAKHVLLRDAGLPAPEVALATEDHLLVLRELPGTSLATGALRAGRPVLARAAHRPSRHHAALGGLAGAPAALGRRGGALLRHGGRHPAGAGGGARGTRGADHHGARGLRARRRAHPRRLPRGPAARGGTAGSSASSTSTPSARAPRRRPGLPDRPPVDHPADEPGAGGEGA